MKSIRIASIPQDAWQAGDYVVCGRCGAHLRHYAKVGGSGEVYGLDCAARVAGIVKENATRAVATRAAEKAAAKFARQMVFLAGEVDRATEQFGGDWIEATDDPASETMNWALYHTAGEFLEVTGWESESEPVQMYRRDGQVDGFYLAYTLWAEVNAA